MTAVKYLGPSHFRELSAADFKKLGAPNQKKIVFVRDEATTVHADTADVLLVELADEFEEVAEKQPAGEDEPMTDSANDDEVDHPDGHLAPEDQA